MASVGCATHARAPLSPSNIAFHRHTHARTQRWSCASINSRKRRRCSQRRRSDFVRFLVDAVQSSSSFAAGHRHSRDMLRRHRLPLPNRQTRPLSSGGEMNRNGLENVSAVCAPDGCSAGAHSRAGGTTLSVRRPTVCVVRSTDTPCSGRRVYVAHRAVRHPDDQLSPTPTRIRSLSRPAAVRRAVAQPAEFLRGAPRHPTTPPKGTKPQHAVGRTCTAYQLLQQFLVSRGHLVAAWRSGRDHTTDQLRHLSANGRTVPVDVSVASVDPVRHSTTINVARRLYAVPDQLRTSHACRPGWLNRRRLVGARRPTIYVVRVRPSVRYQQLERPGHQQATGGNRRVPRPTAGRAASAALITCSIVNAVLLAN